MLESLPPQLKNMFATNSATTPLKIIAIVLVFAFLWYLIFAKKDYKSPLWAFVVLVIGISIFWGFFYAGHKFGQAIGIGDLGTFIGIAAFFFVASLWKYFTTPKDERRKKFM